MPDRIALTVNGKPWEVDSGASVAVALMIAHAPCRTSVRGEPRGPLCAMGICMECRAVVKGVLHQRTCQLLCESGMDVRTAPREPHAG